MPVNLLRAPAKGLETPLVRRHVMAQHGGLALAEPVYVHHGNQVVQVVEARQCGRFPHRALGAFAVAEQDIGAVVQFVEVRAQRHSDADAQALA